MTVSLYQQDAALRVIAKLKQELDGKKQEISSVLEQIAIEQNKKSANWIIQESLGHFDIYYVDI